MAAPAKKFPPQILVPALVSAAVLLLALTPVLGGMDKALYDLMLGVKPAPPPAANLLLLDIDDIAIKDVGVYPWPRSILADGLVTLRELGLGQIVFDIEYIDPSPPGVNKYYLDKKLQLDFETDFKEISGMVEDLFLALKNKQLALKDADSSVAEVVATTDDTGKNLYKAARQVAIDNDLYLGQALAYFGQSYITLNRQPAPKDPKDMKPEHRRLLDLAASRFARPFTGGETRPAKYGDFFVPLEVLVSRAGSAGMTNVFIDEDGKRRRIRLFEQVEGKWYPQLAFGPTLDLLGKPEVRISDNDATLIGARLLNGTVQDIKIPLDSTGHMLISWQKEKFEGSFKHLSFNTIVKLREQEGGIVERLQTLGSSEAWQVWDGFNEAEELVTEYDSWAVLRDKALGSGTAADVAASLTAKNLWIGHVKELITRGTLAKLSDGLRALPASDNQADVDAVIASFDENRNIFLTDWQSYQSNSAKIREIVKDRLGFVGYSGTGTTDLGANPFQQEYPLVGTHPNVVNTILSQSFITELPSWWSLVLAPLLAFALIFLLRNLPPLAQNLAGVGVVAAFALLGLLLFVFTGIFMALMAPLLAMFLSFVAFSLVRFLGAEQEKAFITKAFSTYLSPDVIDEIVQDPSKMKLGGDNKWMTAMFTDVKGFSTISEKLTAPELVHLLNEYLSGMSDIVLNEKGTIDKYEGDAIIAFFGAPLDLPDHAARACLAAIRMRQAEEKMNPGFLERNMSPVPLMTRIGINTGEMVVGNMGTERKMNYTIMGNAVNLSARLEGVNKQYGTWILTTEFTATEAGERFLFRRLDRVRVVGINTPVRLMNLVGLREEVGQNGEDLVTGFHAALDVFEERRWPEAAALFLALAKRFPEDGPCQLYAKRCQAIVAGTLKVADDGVFNLTEK